MFKDVLSGPWVQLAMSSIPGPHTKDICCPPKRLGVEDLTQAKLTTAIHASDFNCQKNAEVMRVENEQERGCGFEEGYAECP
jgi:hypothetical protein